MRHRAKALAHIGHQVRIGDHHLQGLVFAQIAEFPKHIVGGPEIQRHGLIRIVKTLGRQKNMAENFVLRIQEVNISRCDDHFAQAFPQADYGPVKAAQLFIVLGHALCQHKAVVGQGLDLQKVVEGGDALQLVLALAL